MAMFQVWQGNIMVASVESPERHVALGEIARYAMQYAEEGPIEIREVEPRKKQCAPTQAGPQAKAPAGSAPDVGCS